MMISSRCTIHEDPQSFNLILKAIFYTFMYIEQGQMSIGRVKEPLSLLHILILFRVIAEMQPHIIL